MVSFASLKRWHLCCDGCRRTFHLIDDEYIDRFRRRCERKPDLVLDRKQICRVPIELLRPERHVLADPDRLEVVFVVADGVRSPVPPGLYLHFTDLSLHIQGERIVFQRHPQEPQRVVRLAEWPQRRD
jgi:hypothetical protein